MHETALYPPFKTGRFRQRVRMRVENNNVSTYFLFLFIFLCKQKTLLTVKLKEHIKIFKKHVMSPLK